jgi:sulfur-carrier protein
MATVKIPPVLRAQTGGAAEVAADGANVGDVLRALADAHPDTRAQLFSGDGELNRYVNVYLNDEDVRVLEGLDTPASDIDTVVILPAMAGGSVNQALRRVNDQGSTPATAADGGEGVAAFTDLWGRLGPETKSALIDLLPDDWDFRGKRVMDFGCGPGRTLQHFLAEAEEAEIWGADIDAASIEGLRKAHSPPLRVMRCEVDPPLGLEYGSFDLVWAISVFTHLTDNSVPWLLELHRLLKPGGLLIATYMGRWSSEVVAGEPWEEDTVGRNVLRHNHDWNHGGPLVLISDWWLRAHWGRAFDVLEIAPRIHNQSWALLRKRDVELSAEDLEKPEDDPREYLALRHNLRQVQRELELVEAERATALNDVQSAYEGSLSWRVTRPLRAAARTARSLRARRSR